MTSDPKYLQIHNNPPAERILWEKARSRFKEEVLKALEGMKKCQPGAWGENECAACREGFKEDCTTNAIQDAIETIKKL